MGRLLALCSKLWNAEPILVAVFGSAAFWSALFSLLSAFGHGLTDSQEHALAGLAVLLAGFLARSKTVAPDTHQAAVEAAKKEQP